jgi:hypothetical protein
MPSIDLAQLRQQGVEMAGLLGDPPAFRISLRSLLDRHSHRLLRRGRSLARRSTLPAWDVPGLLVRELEAALLPAAAASPEAAFQAAAAIWPEGKLEEKQLAAFLAGMSRDPGEIRALLLNWLQETEDPAVLEDLARRMCPPLWNSNGLLFRSDIRGWIADTRPSRRRFGWTALGRWTEEKSSDSFFAAFEFLQVAFSETDPEALQSAAGLMAVLADGSPRETQAWLSELTPQSRQRGRRFLRTALARLPGETADFLRELLRKG